METVGFLGLLLWCLESRWLEATMQSWQRGLGCDSSFLPVLHVEPFPLQAPHPLVLAPAASGSWLPSPAASSDVLSLLSLIIALVPALHIWLRVQPIPRERPLLPDWPSPVGPAKLTPTSTRGKGF
ncbi:hypothetical protein HJG60_008458 [Phyllostomus discolor]|uniref:Uncharacterized protein n=1 Tax=Phyllostomus discolor TaxID=89673 RepID=A0A833Z4A4_9CHIR|nr:hypothetical protein HJG60_008458 [Phyllostomus discolor]